MGRPVKWSRDLYTIRDRAKTARTETWSRTDLQILFGVGRASAQSIMKAIGDVQPVGASHFVERTALLGFLEEMIRADSVEDALRSKLIAAAPVPRPKTLRSSLTHGLRRAMLPDLPANIVLSPGRIQLTADTAESMVEALVTLAMVMQNDLDRWEQAITPTRLTPSPTNEDFKHLFSNMRKIHDDEQDDALF